MKHLLLLPMLAVTGCADPHQALAPDFGNAITTNMAAQVINPGPNTTMRTATSDGKRIGDAMQRYRTGRVYPPKPAMETVVREGQAAPLEMNVTTNGQPGQ